jgi:hypothetical protein
VEADAISDGEEVFIPSVMEHIELAGIHSGDSACAIPPRTLSEEHIGTINEYTRRIAIDLKVVGLCNNPINMQRLVANGLGVEPEQVFLEWIGLNHVNWVRRIFVAKPGMNHLFPIDLTTCSGIW